MRTTTEQIVGLTRVQTAVRGVLPRTFIRNVPGDVPALVVFVEPDTGRVLLEVVYVVDDYDVWLEGDLMAADLRLEQVTTLLVRLAAAPERTVHVGPVDHVVPGTAFGNSN